MCLKRRRIVMRLRHDEMATMPDCMTLTDPIALALPFEAQQAGLRPA